MAENLSFRAAARRVGCTHRAIGEAVRAGRMKLTPDGLLAPEVVDEWHRNRRTPRGGAHRRAVSTRKGNRIPHAEILPPDLALNVSLTIDCGAVDLAELAMRHLPEPAAREIAAEWLVRQRASWVGTAAEEFEPMCVTDEWPEPPGGGLWREHPFFLEPVRELEWTEARAQAAAWRAERGLAPL